MPDEQQPPFEAPWQARAFALTVHLHEQGHFSWGEWSAALAQERRRSAEQGIADAPEQYYRDWLRALERLLVELGAAGEAECSRFRAAWVAAYKATPHGQPVRLEAGLSGAGH